MLQETHTKSDNDIKIYQYATIHAIYSPIHGIATLVRSDLSTALVAQSLQDAAMQSVAVRIKNDWTVVNVYKPPRPSFKDLPVYNPPVIYSGDFNSHHTTWRYRTNKEDCDKIAEWSSNTDLKLLYNHKLSKKLFILQRGTPTLIPTSLSIALT